MVALDLFDVQDLPVVEHREVGGLAGGVGELLEERLDAVDPVDLGRGHGPELPQLEPEPVAPGQRVLGDDAAPPE